MLFKGLRNQMDEERSTTYEFHKLIDFFEKVIKKLVGIKDKGYTKIIFPKDKK